MKRHFFLLAAILFSAALFAEAIPAGYYSAINGKKDAALKTALSQIIYPVDWSSMTQTSSKPNYIIAEYNAGRRCKYGSRGVDEEHEHQYTWDGFLHTDTHDDGSVWDMYSPYIYYMAPDIYGAVSIPDQEIEHCFPKSWWGGVANSNENDAFRDLHHLNPSNAKANNNKSNWPPGVVTSSASIINELFKKGKNTSYGDFTVFEPCDEYKGDFARAYFYVATAYENFVWQDAASDYLDNTSYLEFKPWLQQVLLDWHRLDPVSEKEITRNNRVSDIQHNRNPFIDYPELVEYIWGNKQNTAVNLAQLTFTGDEAYELPIETLVSRALPATNISESGFTANWKDNGKESYQLDVYTTETTGHNDTILNMPIFNKAIVQADTHFSYNGDYFGTTGSGKSSVTFYKSSTSLVLTISGISIPANTRLVLRAMAPLKLSYTGTPQMKITAGSYEVVQDLTNDEVYYSYNIPAGASSIVIQPGNNKPINVQQLFLIAGNEATTHNSLEGFPKSVTGTHYDITYAMTEGTTLYYTITPAGLRTSAPITVRLKNPTSIDTQTVELSPARKEIHNGQIVILRNESIYTPLGQRVK